MFEAVNKSYSTGYWYLDSAIKQWRLETKIEIFYLEVSWGVLDKYLVSRLAGNFKACFEAPSSTYFDFYITIVFYIVYREVYIFIYTILHLFI